MDYKIYTDGASRGNPGESGIGAVIYKDGKQLKEIYEYIGIATNNDAEYEAVIKGLEGLKKEEGMIEGAKIEIIADSELMVKQMKGEYKIKKHNLIEKSERLKKFIENNKLKISFKHVMREENTEADTLANKALDTRI